ncbi:hypothetical protein HanHA89_Chr04g0156751 [Helianthus annuus]|nr:hypothetical protein HanHA89_Chr04g0156751 [Helianthus annuus]
MYNPSKSIFLLFSASGGTDPEDIPILTFKNQVTISSNFASKTCLYLNTNSLSSIISSKDLQSANSLNSMALMIIKLMRAQVWRSGPSCIWRPKIV